MNKGMAPAIIVEAIVLALAFVFSATYFNLGLYDTSQIHTIILVLVWILVGSVLLVVLWLHSLRREEMVRRFYLNKDYIYNHEIGCAPISAIVPDGDAYELVTFAAESLARMSYGFEVASVVDDFTPEFLVKSSVFAFHEPYEEEEAAAESQASAQDEKPVVIDRWEGSLLRTAGAADEHDYEVVGAFQNAHELAQLLEAHGALRDDAAAGTSASVGEGAPGTAWSR